MDNQTLINRAKSVMGFRKEYELAQALGVSPILLSSWKRSKGQLFKALVQYAVENKLDINSFLYPETVQQACRNQKIRILSSDDLYEYIMNPTATLRRIPYFTFPLKKDVSLAFQVISPNMEPSLSLSSYVFTAEVQKEDLVFRKVYVLLVHNQGLLILRYEGEKENKEMFFTSDNSEYSSYTFTHSEIKNYFEVRGTFEKL